MPFIPMTSIFCQCCYVQCMFVLGGNSFLSYSLVFYCEVCRMGRGDNMGHLTQPGRRQKTQQEPLDVEPFLIRFLRTFKEILKFVLFSYTVLFGALLLARWTTYFMVGKWQETDCWRNEPVLGLVWAVWALGWLMKLIRQTSVGFVVYAVSINYQCLHTQQ